MERSELWRVRPWLVMLGGVLVHLAIGSYYTFGNINPYVTSYVRLRGKQRNATYGDAVWIYTFLVSGSSMAMLIGGYLGEKLGSRWTTLLGSAVFCAGNALSYFTCHDLNLLMITYGIMVGVGMGIAYINPLICAMRWLPHHRGMASGIVVAGFGASSTIFTQVQTYYINPDDLIANIESDEKNCIQTERYFGEDAVLDRVPSVFLLQGGIYAALTLIGCLLISDPPSENEASNTEETPLLKKAKKREEEATPPVYQEHFQFDVTLFNRRFKFAKISETATAASLFGRGLTLKEAVRTHLFWLLYSVFLFSGQPTIYLNNMYKTFGQTFISSDHFLAAVGTASSPMNAIARPLWGAVADRYGYKPTMLALGTTCAGLLLTYFFTSLTNRIAYAFWTPALFFCIGGNYAVWPYVTTRSFGPEHSGSIYGLLFTSQMIGGVIGAVAMSQLTCSIGYSGIIALCAGCQVTAVILALLYPDPPRKAELAPPSAVYPKVKSSSGPGTQPPRPRLGLMQEKSLDLSASEIFTGEESTHL